MPGSIPGRRGKRTIFYRLTDNEWDSQIREELTNLQTVGIIIESVTSDGGASIIKAVKKACPDAVKQRCRHIYKGNVSYG